MVPAYTMPKNIEDVVVMRIVVRQGMSRDMADMLMGDIRNAIAEFEQLEYPTTSRIKYENKEHQKGKSLYALICPVRPQACPEGHAGPPAPDGRPTAGSGQLPYRTVRTA